VHRSGRSSPRHTRSRRKQNPQARAWPLQKTNFRIVKHWDAKTHRKLVTKTQL
jgi:hypothetical protein